MPTATLLVSNATCCCNATSPCDSGAPDSSQPALTVSNTTCVCEVGTLNQDVPFDSQVGNLWAWGVDVIDDTCDVCTEGATTITSQLSILVECEEGGDHDGEWHISAGWYRQANDFVNTDTCDVGNIIPPTVFGEIWVTTSELTIVGGNFVGGPFTLCMPPITLGGGTADECCIDITFNG